MSKISKISFGAMVIGISISAPSALALNNFPTVWSDFYNTYRADYGLPTINTDSLNNALPDGCQLCHERQGGSVGVGGLNPYGSDWRSAWPSSRPSVFELEQALLDIEPVDSDTDPTASDNLTEIIASTQPGWNINDNPPNIIGDLDPSLAEPPVADANGPYSGLVGELINFDGTGSTDPDGTIVSYEWTFGDGNTATGPTPSHTYTTAGVYNINLTVIDNDGLPDSASTTATIDDVPPPPEPPVADANGPYTGVVGESIIFDGTGSLDPDGTIVQYDWNFGDGTIALDAGPMPAHTYVAIGNYNVTLTVTDDDGLTDENTTTAAISEAPPVDLPPVADANGPYSGTVGETITFDGSGSTDPNGDDTIVSYNWDFGDGNSGTGVNPSHSYATADNYTVTLTVIDDTGLSDEDTTTASIGEGPLAPTADANGPYTGTTGIPVTFDASGSTDPNNDIVSYFWDFGDGTTAETASATVEHTYTTEGVYDISLTVTDSTGLSDADATTAEIAPAGTEADVYLSEIRAPAQMKLRVDREKERVIRVFGDGDTITQQALVTLTADVPDGLEVEIEPGEVTEIVEPGGRDTRFKFEVEIECEDKGDYTILWTATIDAVENADPTNDSLNAETLIQCIDKKKGRGQNRDD